MTSNKLHILVVDDEAIVGKRLKPALEREGHEVETFERGADAIACIDEVEFDVVVTDIRMDEVDGLQVLDHALARSPRTKVIIISGYATLELAREALAKGAFDFVAKPFKPEELREAIRRAAAALKE